MGTTLEFYAADPQEFVTLFSLQDEQTFFDQLKTYPVADFSLHLLIPDDMDRLCKSLIQQGFPVPPTFRDLLSEQVWYDSISESLTVISGSFATALAGLRDTELIKVAQDWSIVFHYKEPLEKTPAYQALVQLRKVAQDAVAEETSLILHIVS